MELNTLTAISPIDGRYRSKCAGLAGYFSEYGLIRYRLRVEVEYFVALTRMGLPQIQPLSEADERRMRALYLEFSTEDAERIKAIESITNHDVKAVEYFIKEKMDAMGVRANKEFVHFGLTSQDINNTAVPMSLREALHKEYIPALQALIEHLRDLSRQWSDLPMLARTHGQPASPTTLGKELYVYVSRLETQVRQLLAVPVSGKFGGATGNFNAHRATFPQVDWQTFAQRFLSETLGIEREPWTTQISNYDNMSALFDAMRRINTIILDLDRDMWMYISMDYFKQRIREGEVGSSAMPHKVNPIDFENSEGNLGVSNALLSHLASKLPVSRLQRDLTDSTVLRNVGVPMAHSLIAIASTEKGLGKLLLNRHAIDADLDAMWSVVAEGIQTILRREGYPNPYEALKALTRTNAQVTEATISEFVDSLEVSDAVKAELHALTPRTYIGYTVKNQ